uniref:Protein arginine N-methyltransferase n=1 Tax=Glossina austeni TaxID=7395 RepID=A0A1A9UE89_GLOAU
MSYLCLLQEGNANLQLFMKKANMNGFSVIAAPINAMEIPQEIREESMNETNLQFTYGDLLLTSNEWNSKMIVILSDSIDCDSSDPIIRKNSEKILERDVSWAGYLQCCGYTMLKLKHGNNLNLARVMTQKIKGIALIQVPLYNAAVAQAMWRRDLSEENVLDLSRQDTWQWWNLFRRAANFDIKLRVVLEFNEFEEPDLDFLHRWLGEPIEAVIIPSSIFTRDCQNNPTLPEAWQKILLYFLQLHVNIIVSTGANSSNLKLYSDYLRNFQDNHKDAQCLQDSESVLKTQSSSLYGNLDCQAQEISGKKSMKYKFYQNAIAAALIDRVSDQDIDDKLTVIMILGAGKGSLVHSALNAAEYTKRKIRVYIIEQTLNAIRKLTALVEKFWSTKDVRLFLSDMGEVSPPEKADILISELSGSFKDHELFLKRLDYAQHFLKPDGISMPCQSTSYVNPIMSFKIFNDLRQVVHKGKFAHDRQGYHDPHSESGLAVPSKAIYDIGFPQPLFEFSHPSPDAFTDNSLYKILKFSVKMDSVLTGIFLKTSTISYYKRKQFVRSIWNIAFYAASSFFLYFYNEYMILPQLLKNQGRYSLFYSSENLIFYKSQQCEKFQFYSLFIITFYLHGAMLDLKESDYLETASKSLYLLTLIAMDVYKYEYYFVGLNLNIGIYNIVTDFLVLLALQNSKRNLILNQIFLGMRIASWSHVFVSLLPFKYLVPTLFAKNFKLILNIVVWLWYGLSIWNSPVLQYFYHQIYHNSPTDCCGEGSAAKCIMLKDSSEYRHFKALKKAYIEVKISHEKLCTSSFCNSSATENSSAKAFQAIKCIMTLKRKLKRIREGRGGEVGDDNED